MSENSSERDKNNAKIGLIGFGLLLFALSLVGAWGMWLWALAFIVTFGLSIVGVFLIIRSNSSGDRESQAVNSEIEALANDASFDISEQIIFWDRLRLSKGVGTQLEGRDEEISGIHRRLVNARDEIAAAVTPRHQIEAVLAADSVLATARSLR